MDTKQKIYKTSAELISQYWYKNVSVDQIVQKIGIAKWTFYNYYKSKEDLYISMIDEIFDHMQSSLSDLRKEFDDPKQRFFQYLHKLAFFYDENTIISSLAKSNKLYYSNVVNKEYLFERFQNNLKCLLNTKELKALEQRDIDIQDIVGIVYSFILLLSNKDKLHLFKDYQEYLNKHIKILVDGLFRYDIDFDKPDIEQLKEKQRECKDKIVFSV